MVIAAVDPNKKDLAKLMRYLRMVFHGCEVVMFSDPAFTERYIIKPVTREAIRESLNDTKYSSRQQGGI